MKRRRLLYISETMVSGVLSCVSGLCNSLINDFDITLAYGVRPDTPENLATLFDPRVELIQVKNFTRAISLTKDPAAFFEIRAIAKACKPDIIHLHSSKAGVIGRIAFAWGQTPVFYTPHGYSFLMTDCSPARRRLYHMIEAACTLGGAHTVSCSPSEDRESRKMTRRAHLVCNGINTQELSRAAAEAELVDHPFTVFMLGRICTPRNPEVFNAIALQNPTVHFLWIGDGELKDLLTAPNIEITGWADRREALRLAVNADVFLLPSLWEGLPMSLLEAMYLRKPCIVSNIPGNRDVIHNGENGFVCNNLAEYTAAIETIRAGHTEALVQRAYEDILSTYNTNVQSEGFRKLYVDALREKED